MVSAELDVAHPGPGGRVSGCGGAGRGGGPAAGAAAAGDVLGDRAAAHQIAEAQAGKRFLLQGGDCAETLADCRPDVIARKLKILLQMSLVLIHGGKKPVIRVGRFAGQYAKPRSSATEVARRRDAAQLLRRPGQPPGVHPRGAPPDPELLLQGYLHAGMTINFVRSLAAGGFADLHHPEYWDIAHLSRADAARAARAVPAHGAASWPRR